MYGMKLEGMPKVRFVQGGLASARSWRGTEAELLLPSLNPGLVVGGSVSRQPVVGILGGPGTGKSSLLVDLAVDYMLAGVPAERILVIAQSKEAAAQLRKNVDARLAAHHAESVGENSSEWLKGAGPGGMVRALHSLAFAVVRDAAVGRGEPEPSLTTGARQDAVVRQLLAGHAEDGGSYWPQSLRPALSYLGMARAVRDFLLRAAERGLDGSDLQKLGEEEGIEQWVAAGKFMDEYQQTMRLAWEPSLNAAELVTKALAEIDLDPSVLSRCGKEIVLIDDAEHLSPESARLVHRFVEQAAVAVIAGDEDQSVFHFRGASNEYLRNAGRGESGQVIELQHSYRCRPEVAAVANAVAQKLPKPPSYRGIESAGMVEREKPAEQKVSRAHASVRISTLPTSLAERGTIADYLRRAHAERGIAWRDMAVIVRAGAGETSLFRALSRAGVPVQVDPTDVVLSQQRLVRALLVAAKATENRLQDHEWDEFLAGPLVNMDPIIKARLLRGIRRADLGGAAAQQQLIGLLRADHLSSAQQALIAQLAEREQKALAVPLGILKEGREALAGGVESTLWALWSATGLAEHLTAASLRGGAAGASADRDLDAVMALFDFAGDSVELNPKLSLSGFITSVEEQELPIGTRDRSGIERDAVRILSAHAALGSQWSVVVVAGVQEGVWPNFGVTGSVMKQDQFIGLMDHGIAPSEYVVSMADQLAEERRLMHVAVSRASDELLITAVNSPDEVGVPSPFVNELAEAFPEAIVNVETVVNTAVGQDEGDAESDGKSTDTLSGNSHEQTLRVLSLESLLAELRAAAVSPEETETRRRQAARQLARLAKEEVPGAHPNSWWGLRPPSTDVALIEGKPIVVNPSRIESALKCPLKAMMDKSSPSEAMHLGSVFHLAAEAISKGVSVPEATEEIRRVFADLSGDPEWRRNQEIERWVEALHAWDHWISAKNDMGSEVKVKVALNQDVTIVGRIDRLIADSDGALQIVDIKTAKNPASKEEVQDHAQLATYQLALSCGQLIHSAKGTEIVSGDGVDTSGAYLVYPRKPAKGSIATREQAKLTEEQAIQWKQRVKKAAESVVGPKAFAIAGDHCKFCSLRKACPTAEGRR